MIKNSDLKEAMEFVLIWFVFYGYSLLHENFAVLVTATLYSTYVLYVANQNSKLEKRLEKYKKAADKNIEEQVGS